MSVSQRTPKRVRVEGVPNLYRRPVDGRYEVGYTGSDGKWHMRTLVARSLTEAKAELRQVLGKRDQRQDVTPSRLTLNEVADQLFIEFESKVSRGERSERTLEIYRQRWNTHIRPTLGRRRLQSIGVREASRFLAELRRKASPRKKENEPPELLSNWTVRGVLNVLNVVLEHAVKHEYIASIRCRSSPARSRLRRTARRHGYSKQTKSRV